MRRSVKAGVLVLLTAGLMSGAASVPLQVAGGSNPLVATAAAADKTLQTWQYLDEGFNLALALRNSIPTAYSKGFRCVRLGRSKASCVAWADYIIWPSLPSKCSACHVPVPGKPQYWRVYQSVVVRYVGQHYRTNYSIRVHRRRG